MAKWTRERPADGDTPETPANAGVRFMVDLLEHRTNSMRDAANGRDGEEMDSGDKEKELERIESQIKHLEAAAGGNQDARRQLHSLHDQVNTLRKQIYAHMHAWQKTE